MDRLINQERDSGAWDLITGHLIATANYPSTPGFIRTQCCAAIADIIIRAMDYSISEHKEPDERLQTRLLTALNQCINYAPPRDDVVALNNGDKSNLVKAFSEVQRMSLETLNKLLQTSGHSFTCGWGLIFDMIRHVTISSINHQNELTISEDDTDVKSNDDERVERASIDTTSSSLKTAANTVVSNTSGQVPKSSSGLIKVAFSSLQLICTDFLSLLSPDCLRQCIATLGAFGMQSEDVNISLTAIGLLWNLSDFIQTKRAELAKKQNDDLSICDEKIEKSRLNIDQSIGGEEESTMTMSVLWMLLLLQLCHICTDWRPEVRNGANQTLFRTITMNGDVLGPNLWSCCMWEVLFPLLDAIKMSSIRAVKIMLAQGARSPSLQTAGDRDASGFMLHHSRDSADKQWDETKVLVLSGISGIFRDYLGKLRKLPHFKRAWFLLLAHLEDSCLRSSQEVSLASIKSFREILSQPFEGAIEDEILTLWRSAWECWQTIGEGITAAGQEEPSERIRNLDPELHSLTLSLSSSSIAPISGDFSQDMLTVYVNTFLQLYTVIKSTFSLNDVKNMLSILRNVLVYSTSPQYRPDIDHLSPLQESVLNVIQALEMDDNGIPPLVLRDLSEYMTLAFLSPESASEAKGYTSPSQRRYSSVTYIALNKRCSRMVVELFKRYIDNVALYSEGVFEAIIGAYGLPMKLKYDCPPSYKHGEDKTPLWKLATTNLLEILCPGLETLHKFGEGN